MQRRRTGVALVALSAAAFGGLPIFARLAYADGADVIAVLASRFAIAAALMGVVLAVRRQRLPRGRLLAALAAMGGIGYVGQSASYFTALTMASAGLVALLLYLYPAIVTLLSAVILRDRLRPVTIAALGLALAGSALTIGPVRGGRLGGVVLGIAAALIYSVYILVGSRVTPRAGALPASAVVMAAAAVVYGLVALITRPAVPSSAEGWGAITGLAVVSTVVAIVAFFAGLERIGPADASTLSTLEPVVSVGLAAVVLGEGVAPLQLGGGVLILAAVAILARSGTRQPAAATVPATAAVTAPEPIAVAEPERGGHTAKR